MVNIPLPEPESGETEEEWMSRCMSNSRMENEFSDEGQRYAVCSNIWEDSKGGDGMDNKQRNFKFEVKEINDEDMTFEGYGSVFGNVDSYNDVVVKGAFAKTLQEQKGKIKILWQHRSDMPIGKIIEAKEDEFGLWIKAKLVNGVDKAEEAYKLLKEGVLDGLSIGYSVIKDEYDREENLRYLKEIKLFEISVVSFNANSLSLVTDVKSLKERLGESQKDLIGELESIDLIEERWEINDALYRVIQDLLQDDELSNDEKLAEFANSLGQFSELMTEWFSKMLSLEKSELIDIDTKAGKVLSAKNKTIVKNAVKAQETAIESLTSLLEATEPDKSTQKQKEAEEKDGDKEPVKDDHSKEMIAKILEELNETTKKIKE